MALNKNYRKWDVVLVILDPVIGKEISKTRPCLIISPNVMNKYLQTIIVAPLTSSEKNYPSRLRVLFNNKHGEVCFDHLKSIDKNRVLDILGTLDIKYRAQVNELLRQMFSEL